ncbi:hypothetical protein ABZ897_53960 [Nonomuraea sp. NPDC046802]|uniref:hypothetical protein n=1 Tax=Nonomuraea sp. NPDC046802 TaxID=3154919 RepID=UPI0033C98CF7
MEDVPPTDEPALYFNNDEFAEDALVAWLQARQTLEDRRDALIRGALAAGVTPTRLNELKIAARTTTDRIKKHYPTADVAVAQPPIIEYAYLLKARAERLTSAPDQPYITTTEGQTYTAFARMMHFAGDRILQPPADTSTLSEDAHLQSLAAQYRRVATQPADTGWDVGVARAYAQLAQEITVIRRSGTKAFSDYFDPNEVAAGQALLAESNRQAWERFATEAGYASYEAWLAAQPAQEASGSWAARNIVDSDEAIAEVLSAGSLLQRSPERYGDPVPGWAHPAVTGDQHDARAYAESAMFLAAQALSSDSSRDELVLACWRRATAIGYHLGITGTGKYPVRLRMEIGGPIIAGHLAAHAIGLICPEPVRADVQALTQVIWPSPMTVHGPGAEAIRQASHLHRQIGERRIPTHGSTATPGLDDLVRLGMASASTWASALRTLLRSVTLAERAALQEALGRALHHLIVPPTGHVPDIPQEPHHG